MSDLFNALSDKLKEGYKAVLEDWGNDAYLVKLPTSEVKGSSNLKNRFKVMRKLFRKSLDATRDSLRDENGNETQRLELVRKLECSFFKKRKTYKPYYNVLVRGEYAAQTLLNEWEQKTAVSKLREKEDFGEIKKFKRQSFRWFFGVTLRTKFKESHADMRTEGLGKVKIVLNGLRRCRIFKNYGIELPEVEESMEEVEQANE